MKLRLEVKQWLARESKVPTLFDAEILRETDKAYLCSGVGAVDAYAEHINCIHCGRELTHPVSRYVGIGPICCGNLGVPWDIPESASPEEIEALKRLIKVVTRFNDKWIPKSQIKSKVVLDDTPLATLASDTNVLQGTETEPPSPTITPTTSISSIAGSQAVPLPPLKQVDFKGGHFHIVSPYDPDLITRIKGLDKSQRAWSHFDKTWRLAKSTALFIVELVEKDGFTITADAKEALRLELEARKKDIEEAQVAEISEEVEELLKGVDASFGLELMPFQREALAYTLNKKSVLLAQEMGLGKSPIALAAIEADDAYPALIVCPKTVWSKWGREIEKCLPHRRVKLLSMYTDMERADIFVINYDILHHYEPLFKAMPLQSLILDESHRIKNKDARRSKICIRLMSNPALRYKLLLSGTPIKNRPVELVNQLIALDKLGEFGGFRGFVWRYCNPKHNGWGWDFNGASNLGDLNLKLRRICMTQHDKKDVLPELPEALYTIIPTELSDRAHYERAEADIILWLRNNVSRAKAEAAARAEQLVKINTLRHLVAEQKMPYYIEWIEDFLESSEEKLLVFGWHQNIIEGLATYFHAPLIKGGISSSERQAAEDRFQTDPECRLLFCNIISGGEGINLTAATNVAFLELPWTWADIKQAIARCYGRISDIHGANVYYLLGERTIDTMMYALIEKKKQILGEAIMSNGAGNILDDLVAELIK